MHETDLFKKLKRITPGFHWTRHEDKFTSGIPDCSYGYQGRGGWVELKTYDHFPLNPDSPVKMPDLKPSQRNWCTARGKAQGSVWFLIQVANEWFLISWKYARRLGSMTHVQLIQFSSAHGVGPLTRDIVSVLGDHNDSNQCRRPKHSIH